MSRLLVVLVCLIGAGLVFAENVATAPALPPAASGPVDFFKDIKPLLESSCVQCHAKGKDKGGFSLETREKFLKGGDTGPAAVTGDSAHSLIVRLVAGVDPDSQMPKKGKKWTAQQVGLLRAWIDQGAPWPAAVSFARPEPANLKPHVANVPEGNEPHPVDRILARYFADNHLALPPVVDDRVFARRVFLDVIGLLPTPEQLNSFVADPSPDKRRELVRGLLSDNRGYVDHWLTFWNDLLRNDYRGTGFIDGGRKQISGWLYAALFNNEPYDRFVSQLVDPTPGSEGFSRGIIWRGTVNASQQPPMQAAQNISQVMLGVNLKCASCHDSFVSDWTLADAYGMAAMYSDGPLELVHCDKPTGKTSPARFLYPQLGSIDSSAAKGKRLKEFCAVLTGRGDGRLSRTIVNRLWARLLGRGLVEPVDEMDKPAWSPDVLDWLAEDLVAHQYDLKRTIEMILTSRAYQMPAVELPPKEKTYVFRGPLPRKLTAEQFCDAVTSLSDNWNRLPATLDIDFTVDPQTGPVTMPDWIWTDQPLDGGQERAELLRQWREAVERQIEEVKAASAADVGLEDPDADEADDDEAKLGKALAKQEKPDPLPRHEVAFRKSFYLDRVPKEAFAVAAASQGFTVYLNGKIIRPRLSDGLRRGRVQLYDVGAKLVKGWNLIAIGVSSHTEKNLNDLERQQFPASRNHLNRVSGVGFYLRANYENGTSEELTSDESWRVFRQPMDKAWKQPSYDDGEWVWATPLPAGVGPVDEGPALPPITRQDFANEPVEFDSALRSATSTAAQDGGIRASLLASDPLMTALDRPNREQVTTVRGTAASTLQALELMHGNSLNDRLKQAAKRLTPHAAEDPRAWVTQIYERCLCREPTEQELSAATEMLGQPVKEENVADFVWAVLMLPEFELIQ